MKVTIFYKRKYVYLNNFLFSEINFETPQPSTSTLTLLFPMTTSISVTSSIDILSTMATPTPTNTLGKFY